MESSPAIPDFVPAELAQLQLALSAEQLDRLARYLHLLLETNKQFNLTGIKEPQAAWRRHIIDSLTLVPLLADCPAGTTVIDVGSGGGLPGVPLAIARPDLRFTLLEATGKKARFLESCIRDVPLPNGTVLNDRAEKAGQTKGCRQHFDVAVCRAVGPLREVLEYLLPLVKVGGQALAMKGAQAEAELEAASDAMMILGAGELQVIQAYPDGWPTEAVLIRLTKERPTPPEYPRLPGTPHQDPL